VARGVYSQTLAYGSNLHDGDELIPADAVNTIIVRAMLAVIPSFRVGSARMGLQIGLGGPRVLLAASPTGSYGAVAQGVLYFEGRLTLPLDIPIYAYVAGDVLASGLGDFILSGYRLSPT
jgi:hypothetical protein